MNDVKSNRLIKALLIILAVLLFFGLCLLMTACECEHDYTERIIKPADCLTSGEAEYTCKKCSDSYTAVLPKLDEHSLSDAYCNDENSHWQTCEICGFVTEKTAHVFTTVSTENSTCTEQGSIVTACECGKTHTDYLPLAEHDYSLYQKQGTMHWQKCANCDAITDKSTHQFTIAGNVIPSTCTVQGTSVTLCVCGEAHTEKLPLKEHEFIKTIYDENEHWLVCATCDLEKPNQIKTLHSLTTQVIEANCVKAGSSVTSCSGCDYSKSVSIDPLGHDLDKSAFSSNSTGSGHYYKCNRCDKDVVEAHNLTDVACQDGYDCDATCCQTGHKDQECVVCGWHTHVTLPMTNEHSLSSEWSSNGTFHWHECVNGEGKDKCTYKGDETQHEWVDRVIEATCTTDGRQWRECSVCAKEQSGSIKTLKATGHDLSIFIEMLEEPTCENSGLKKMQCSKCDEYGEVSVDKVGHDWSKYNFNEQGHWKKCATCGAEQDDDTPSKHTPEKSLDVIIAKADCTTDGRIKHTCQFCKGEYVEIVKAKGHNYVHDDPDCKDPTKFADATCTEYGWYMATCSYCGEHAKIVGDKLEPHSLVYHKAKDPTDMQDGNISYHECMVCHKYFTTKNCETELSADNLILYAAGIKVEGISDLYNIAAGMEDDEISVNYYRITAPVFKFADDKIIINVDGDMFEFFIPDNVRISQLKVGDFITVKAKLYVVKDSEDALLDLVDVQIVEAPKKEGEYLLYVESNTPSSVYAGITYGNSSYNTNTYYFNALVPELEDQLTIQCYKLNEESTETLIKVIVNDEAREMIDGILNVTVSGDTRIKLVFGKSVTTSVTFDQIDASNNNGNAHRVDEYVSYTYIGQYNDDGRILDNSHLIVTVNNANIVGLVITYENYNLSGKTTVLQNKITVGKSDYNMIEQTQNINDNLKVILGFNVSDEYTRIDYFANACQARVVEITILYQTNNTF